MSALPREAFEREHNVDNVDDDGIDETVVIAAEDSNFEHLSINDRPTIPVPAPRDSGVRLRIAHVEWPAATVDVVVCDLSRDPRSEDYAPERANNVSVFRRRLNRARRLFA